MQTRIVLAGIGGQGVLFAHRLLADCALAQGLNVTGAETHGMSQRGGSVVSHLKIGDGDAPLIRRATADFLLALDVSEGLRSLAFVRPGGMAIVDAPPDDARDAPLRAQLAARRVTWRALDASRIARELGRASVANLVLIGCAATCEGFPLSPDALRQTIRSGKAAAANLTAFAAGESAAA